MTDPQRYVATPTGFLMVLQQGDDMFARLEALMREEDVPAASIAGFGFAARATFGYFDFDRGQYNPHTVEQLEITGLTGTLAWQDGEPSIHAHASGGDARFAMHGGHLLGLVVGRGSFEITVIVHPQRLERGEDPAIGAKVL